MIVTFEIMNYFIDNYNRKKYIILYYIFDNNSKQYSVFTNSEKFKEILAHFIHSIN